MTIVSVRMKKIIGIVCVFLFISFFHLNQTHAASTTHPIIVMKPMVTQVPSNDYQLAFPGILPDNPFYKLKVLRDKIWEAITTEPTRKVQLYLLFTDKQMAMVQALVDKHEISLAETTALKAEDNFTKIVFVYRDNNFSPTSHMYQILLNAASKHQQVLNNAIKLAGSAHSHIFQQVINYSLTNVQALTTLYEHHS